MHTGDNMLAIYASEKALRLAERLDEARAASRAHDLRRVFAGSATWKRRGRTWSAPLPSPANPTGRRPSGLCSPSAITSKSPRRTTRARPRPTARRSGLRRRSATCPRRWSCTARRSASWPSTGPTGTRGRARDGGERQFAEREGLHGKLCFPDVMRGILSWRAAQWDDAIRYYTRAHAQGEQVGRSESPSQPSSGSPPRCGTVATWQERRPSSPRRSTSASGRADRPVGRGDLGRAVALALAGRDEQARAVAEEAERLGGGSTTRSARPRRRRRREPPPRRRRPARRRSRKPGAVAGAGTSARRGPLPDGPRQALLATDPDAARERSIRPPRSMSVARRPCSWRPGHASPWRADGLLEAAGPDRGTRRRGLGHPL